jgi:hypothetical protein
MPASSWLIGSIPDCAQNTIRVVANAVSTDINIAAGDYYVFDQTASLSAAARLSAALLSHAQIGSAEVHLQSSGVVRIVTDVACTIQWLTGTEIRDLVGATGTLTPAALVHTLPRSKYIWCPRRQENVPKSRLLTQGWKVYDTQVSEAGTSEIVATTNNEWRENEFEWPMLDNSLVWTDDEDPEEYWPGFYDVVSRRFRRFKMWSGHSAAPVIADSDGSYGTVYASIDGDAGDWTDGTPTILGPYKMLPASRGKLSWDYERDADKLVESRNKVSLKVRQVTEYS